MSVNASIVLYHTKKEDLERVLNSLKKNKLINKVFLIDNSSNKELEKFSLFWEKIVYIFTGKNLGYGKGHNIALRESLKEGVKYHLVMNPDVYFEENVVDKLYEYMEENKDVGLSIPKVLNSDGSLQYACKLLPTPIDLIFRRFFNFKPFNSLVEKRNYFYELRFYDYSKPFEAPFISGAFMFIRVDVLKEVGLFDERYFLYCDDLDLSRRVYKVSKNVCLTDICVYHKWSRGSYKSLKLLYYHIKDAIVYFNKWGWFKDEERSLINKKVLKNLGRI